MHIPITLLCKNTWGGISKKALLSCYVYHRDAPWHDTTQIWKTNLEEQTYYVTLKAYAEQSSDTIKSGSKDTVRAESKTAQKSDILKYWQKPSGNQIGLHMQIKTRRTEQEMNFWICLPPRPHALWSTCMSTLFLFHSHVWVFSTRH